MKSQSKVVFEKICSENQAEILAWLSRLKLITALNGLNVTLFTHKQKFVVSNFHQKLRIRRKTGLKTFTNFITGIFIIKIVT